MECRFTSSAEPPLWMAVTVPLRGSAMLRSFVRRSAQLGHTALASHERHQVLEGAALASKVSEAAGEGAARDEVAELVLDEGGQRVAAGESWWIGRPTQVRRESMPRARIRQEQSAALGVCRPITDSMDGFGGWENRQGGESIEKRSGSGSSADAGSRAGVCGAIAEHSPPVIDEPLRNGASCLHPPAQRPIPSHRTRVYRRRRWQIIVAPVTFRHNLIC